MPPSISFSSLAPPYISSRRSVLDQMTEFHSTPSPHLHHHSTPVSYSTPSSNVYIQSFATADSHKVYQDNSFYHDDAPVHVVTPVPSVHHHEDVVPYSSPAEPSKHYLPPPSITQHYDLPKEETGIDHRQPESHHHFSPLPTINTKVNALPEFLTNLYQEQQQLQHHHKPQHQHTDQQQHHHHPEQEQLHHVSPSFDADYHRLLDLMKHHNYNPSLSDLSSIKSLPELLEHLNVYKDPHPKEDEIPTKGLKVKSLPEYVSPSHHHQYDGSPIEHSVQGVKTLRPKVKPRPHQHQHKEEYYASPAPTYHAPEPPSSHGHVSQLHPEAYPHLHHQKSQDPGEHFFTNQKVKIGNLMLEIVNLFLRANSR